MAGVSPLDGEFAGAAQAQRVRRGGWFSKPKLVGPAPDQEAEVRARLYARPGPTERTVELIGRTGSVERLEDRPAA